MPEISGWLVVSGTNDGGVKYELRLGDERLEFTEATPPGTLDIESWGPYRRLTEWRRQRKAPRWFGLEVGDEFRDGPWTAYLKDALDGDPVVWIVGGEAAPVVEPRPLDDLRLLLAIWPDPSLPGLQRELESLSVLGDRGIHASVAVSPSGETLERRLRADKPVIVHLAPTGANLEGLAYRAESSPDWTVIPTESLVSSMPSSVRLIVINTCDATRVAQELTRRTGILTVTWGGLVADDRALAFALFYYEQLLRGTSPADAILMFSSQSVGASTEHRDMTAEPAPSRRPATQNPVVLIPNRAALDLVLVAPVRPADTTYGRGALESYTPDPGTASRTEDAGLAARTTPIEIEALDVINPALLINGRDTLRSLRITSERDVARAVIEVTCDAGLGVSQVRRTVHIVTGMTPIDVSDFQFPVLYELLRLGVKRRPINFRVRLFTDGTVLAEETRSSSWMGQDEWIDSADTHEYLPAFIDPEAQTVKDVWARARDRLGALAHTEDLSGEAASKKLIADPYVKALYLAIRELKLRYIEPPVMRLGPRGKRLAGQRVRSPAEVLKNGRGTCHDLSLLFAGCMEHIRLYPLVVLVPNHTLIGYWRSKDAHEAYWKANRPWVIRDIRLLRKLLEEQSVSLVEATSVTDPDDISFDQACAKGLARLSKTNAVLDAAIDVRASRTSVDTLELVPAPLI